MTAEASPINCLIRLLIISSVSLCARDLPVKPQPDLQEFSHTVNISRLSFYCCEVCSFIAIMALQLLFVFPTLDCFL